MALTDELEDLEVETDAAKDVVGGNPGPLPQPDRDSLAAHLTTAQQKIKVVVNLIDDAGSVGNSLPSTLAGIAERCHELAVDARRASTEQEVDEEFIGDCVKTIDWLIDAENGYRDKAGIT